MEKHTFNLKKGERIFRIALSLLAILALSAAITYMIRGIILDVNTTQRLLAEAFMSYGTTTDASPEVTSAPISTEASVEVGTPQSIPIVSASLSEKSAGITNYTSYTIDEKALEKATFSLYAYTSSPLVLILHSDIDECYAPDGAASVDSYYDFTDSDPTRTVFAVGEAIAEVLSTSGIGVIHASEEATDIGSTVAYYRALYPSITFVLDIHRDGLYTSDGRLVRTDGKIGNACAAELMLAVGTDAANGGSDWQGNLAAAYRLSSLISSAEEGIMRKTLLRPESLGQQYAPCSLSLYVGSTGNTLSEALTSARFFARYYAIFILSSASIL